MRCMIFITNNEGSCYMGLYEDDGEFIDDLIAFDTSQIQRRCITASFMGTDVCESILLYQSQTCREIWFCKLVP